MNAKRRNLFVLLGSALLGWPSLATGSGKSLNTTQARSTVTPRHVLCFLGGKNGLAGLRKAAQAAISQFGEGFSVDEAYSIDEADDRMERSFAICWDRVAENSFNEADESAVSGHGSILYVLGPPMVVEKTIAISATALRFVEFMLDGGAVAAKGESAGVAHGVDRWKELAGQAHDAAISNNFLLLASTCRLAFARRPIGDPTIGESMETVGFHLIGLPDLVIDEVKLANPKIYTNGDQIEIADFMDAIALKMTESGAGETITHGNYRLSDDERYENDSYKFNPFGIVTIKSLSLP